MKIVVKNYPDFLENFAISFSNNKNKQNTVIELTQTLSQRAPSSGEL